MPKKKKSEFQSFDFKDILVWFVENVIKKIGAEIIDDVKEKSKELVEQIKRKTTGIFFSIVGFIFLLVGISLLLETILPIRGSGFFLSGLLIMLLGVFVTIKK